MPNVPTVAWSETTPAGSAAANQGDDRIREMKTQVREVIDVDHDFPSSGQASDNGQHKVIQLQVQSADPGGTAAIMKVYQKEVSSVNEVFIQDDAGNVIQVTTAGALNAVALSGNQTVAGAKTFTGAAGITLDPANIASSDYTAGNVTVAASATVEGVGTTWSAANIVAGNYFQVSGDNRWYEIASVTDNDTLVLTASYAGVAGSGKSYIIRPSADVVVSGGLATNLVQTAMIADSAVTAAKVATGVIGVTGFVTSTYNGNGAATQAISGVGQNLTSGTWVIVLYKNEATDGVIIKTDANGAYSKRITDNRWNTDMIVSGDADGFTVGDHSSVNQSGKVYTYIVLKGA